MPRPAKARLVRRWSGPRSPRRGRERRGDRLLTVREVAERLAVSTPIVYSLCERGEIRHVRVSNAIRVLPRAPDAFIAGPKK